MISMTNFISELASQRPIFHSEADFQHTFAWQLHKLFPDAKIRLEYPAQLDKWIYLDIWAEIARQKVAVELKYKTTSLENTHNGETFHLKNQSAQDTGRYDFIKDIQRLEQIVLSRPDTIGYAILLTNDSLYWSSTQNQTTVDADFRLHEGQTLSGSLRWSEKASRGTTAGRSDILSLRNTYSINWQPYAALPAQKGDFRYLNIEISK